MDKFAVYTLTSTLHDERAVARISEDFLCGLWPEGGYEFRGADYSDFGTHTLDLIYVRTGGTEGIFKALLPDLVDRDGGHFYLLTSGKSNSLAASMEILSYLKQQGLKGEIIHGSDDYIRHRVAVLRQVEAARMRLSATCLGVIGKPSDWLISSGVDRDEVYEKLGIWLKDIPMEALLRRFEKARFDGEWTDKPMTPAVRNAYPDAVRIYQALKALIEDERLNGFTLRCFDLLTALHNTGCLALARLNAEGIPAGCEGDIPALLSLAVVQAALGRPGFQANPSRIDPSTGEMLFAHCTVGLNLVDGYDFDTHFESGIGVGIRGHFPEGPVTVYKLSGDLGRRFIAEGEVLGNQAECDLCRTQVIVRLSPEDARYFLTDPIGNHHILVPGHHKALLEEIV